MVDRKVTKKAGKVSKKTSKKKTTRKAVVRKKNKETSAAQEATKQEATKIVGKAADKSVILTPTELKNYLDVEFDSIHERLNEFDFLHERLNELSIQILTMPTKKSLQTDSALLSGSPPVGADKPQDQFGPGDIVDPYARYEERPRGFRRVLQALRFWER